MTLRCSLYDVTKQLTSLRARGMLMFEKFILSDLLRLLEVKIAEIFNFFLGFRSEG